MSMRKDLPLTITHEVRDSCLCFHMQRAARTIARCFDDVLRPVGLTNGQFSLLMALNRPQAPTIGEIAEFLNVDRTTLTANLKPLERRNLLKVDVDVSDRRTRRLSLTDAGLDLLVAAVPLWRRQLRKMEAAIGDREAARLRSQLRTFK